MMIKKCLNCGSFTTSEGSLCDNCAKELKFNTTLLNSYFEENANLSSIRSISSSTGIAPSVIQNYMADNNYVEIPNNKDDAYHNELQF